MIPSQMNPRTVARELAHSQYDSFTVGESPICEAFDTWVEWCEVVAADEAAFGYTSEMFAADYPTWATIDVMVAVGTYLETCDECSAGYRYTNGGE